MMLPAGSMPAGGPAAPHPTLLKFRPAMSASLNATRLTPPCGFAPNCDRSVRCLLTRAPFTRQLFTLPCRGSALRASSAWTKSRRFTSLALAGHLSPQHGKGIEIRVHDAFFQRNDRVIGDMNRLGADFGATLGNVAVADSTVAAEVVAGVSVVGRMHLLHPPPG